jgi:hypothetical protein
MSAMAAKSEVISMRLRRNDKRIKFILNRDGERSQMSYSRLTVDQHSENFKCLNGT